MTRRRRVIGLGNDGKLALRSANGTEEPLPAPAKDLGVAILLLDCSGSMAGTKLDQARSGAEDFLKSAISNGYRVGLVGFDSSAELLCAPTKDRNLLVQSLARLSARCSTNLAGAIVLGARHLEGERAGTCALVLVTDGVPDNPKAAKSAAREVAHQGIQIIAIGTGDADRKFLQELVTSEGLALKVEGRRLGQAISSAARLLPGPPR